MSGIPYHAWTHRPKAQGGTDPIENLELPWIRLKLVTGDQTIDGGDEDAIIWEEIVNDYPETFDDFTIVGDILGAKILLPGLYSATGTVYFSSAAQDHVLFLNHIDPDEWASYGIYNTGAASDITLRSFIHIDFRAQGTAAIGFENFASHAVELELSNMSGTAVDVGPGTYLEVRKLGVATMNGRLADE